MVELQPPPKEYMLFQATLPVRTSLADLPPYVLSLPVDRDGNPDKIELNIIVEKGPHWSDAMLAWLRAIPGWQHYNGRTLLAMGDEHAP